MTIAVPRVAPAARRMAEEAGIDLAMVKGTGPGRRIVRADIVRALRDAAVAAPTAAAAGSGAPASDGASADGAARTGAKGATTPVELTRAQAVIARRMAAAKATVPELSVTAEVDAGALSELRERLRAASDPAPSLNDLIVRAVALALREHPRLNGSYREGRLELHERVNVGIAVAAGDTLLVPVLLDADRRPLDELAAESRRLAERARDGALTPSELQGGTFTVSNLGMLGVTRFTAIVNEPQAAILAVGAAVPRAVVAADGTLVAGRVLELTLTADHRIVYGAHAAAFLASVRELLEAPVALAQEGLAKPA
jgi:pyruvate dehydrogenase E2 component (dihydrolipoamide acetyltransferase)